MENYGEKFRIIRERYGLAQKDIASELGLSSASISLRENGERKFKVVELYKVNNIFGIDVGFSRVFDYIDNREILTNPIDMPPKIIEIIKNKDYTKLTIKTMERIKHALEGKKIETQLHIDIKIDLCEEEKVRLRKILQKYQEKDGNILRAIKLLEIAMQ